MSDGSRDDGAGPRRFLIAAVVADYPKNRGWNRPGLLEARDRIVELFTSRLGHRLHDTLPLSPTRQQLTNALRAFCCAPDRREDDLLTLYLSCHGEILDDGMEEHVLLTSDTDPDDLTYTALPTADLTRTMLRGTRIRRVMLLLDACYVGQGANQLAAAAFERLGADWGRSSGSGLVIVSSAQPHQPALTGLFPALLQDAVEDLSVAGHGPAALSVHAVVQHINNSPRRPGHQSIGLSMIGLDGEPPAFLPNPRHDPRLNEVDLQLQREALFGEQDRRRETEFVTRLLVRAMGHHSGHDDSAPEPGWWFNGREAALTDLAGWLDDTGHDGSDRAVCRVVTAGPGSGKTAVLGLIATLAHPERHRTVPLHSLNLPPRLITPGTLDAVVYAQRLTDTDVLEALCAAARVRAGTVGELLGLLDSRERPLTVLIDALDEAATPDTLCSLILRPLVQHSGGRIRLLLGTRPHLLPHLKIPPDQVVDLDSPRYADPRALTVYAARTLLKAHHDSPYRALNEAVEPIARAVADAAGHSFLIARIAAATLAATPTVPDPDDPAWRASLPRHAGDAVRNDLRTRLGDDARRATDLLRPLAYAQGQGLPWEDLWAPLAARIAGRGYTDDDIVWLRAQAGAYLVEATEDDRSAYRLYHEAMAEHLRVDTDPAAVHAAYFHVLTDRVPVRADGTRDWARAHPYTLGHLAHHAARAGQLDQLLTDPDYLVHAAPRGLTPHLHRAHDDTARRNTAVYRTGLHLHRDTTPPSRRQVLALGAARAGAHQLHRDLTGRIPPGAWAPSWATGSTFNPALRDTLTGHTEGVLAVACTTLKGRPVAVSSGADNSVRVWDVATGQPVGQPLTGHTDSVYAVACTTLKGRPVAVSSGADKSVRVWDLTTGQPVGQPLTGHTRPVYAVACTTLDGRPVAVTGSWDNSVRVWDLTTGQPVGQPLTGHTDPIQVVACTTLDGRPVAVTGSWDNSVRVWDLTTGRPVGQPLAGHTSAVCAMACTTLDGRPVAVTGSWDNSVRVWDLTTGERIGQPLKGHSGWVHAVACTILAGRPVAVSGSADNSVRVWDLTTGRPVGQPLTGHTGPVHAVACATLNEQPVAVTGSTDNSVRVWDLTTGQPADQPLAGHTDPIQVVACTTLNGRPVAVTGSEGGSLRVWDSGTGERIGLPLAGHTHPVHAVACTTLSGRPVAVTGNVEGMVRVWDLTTGQLLTKPIDPTVRMERATREGRSITMGAVFAVACTTLNGRPVAVTGNPGSLVRVWDVATGQPISRPLTGHTDSVYGVACTVLDGQTVAVTVSADKSVRVWDVATGQPIGQPLTGHTGPVHAVACTVLDGQTVAVTAGADKSVRVWDVATGQPVGQALTGHTGPVYAVACTTMNGRPAAVTSGADDTVRVWDLRAQALLETIPIEAPFPVAVTATGDLVIGFHNDIACYRRRPHDHTPHA